MKRANFKCKQILKCEQTQTNVMEEFFFQTRLIRKYKPTFNVEGSRYMLVSNTNAIKKYQKLHFWNLRKDFTREGLILVLLSFVVTVILRLELKNCFSLQTL